MKIAVVNDIHGGKILEKNGSIRANSDLIESQLKNILEFIIQHHAPDLLINLGDLIRGEGPNIDLQRYRRLISSFQNLNCPVLHLVGNHEYKNISELDIESTWSSLGFDQKTYGIKQFDNFNLIWLGLEVETPKINRIPELQLEWLERTLNAVSRLNTSKRQTYIFTHCATDDHDTTGNYFYEAFDDRKKTALFLENQSKLRSIIEASGCVLGVFQAHLHYFYAKEVNGIPYITCPAMADNICGPSIENNIPEIYTLLNCKPNHLTVKAYSREYSFCGYEKEWKN